MMRLWVSEGCEGGCKAAIDVLELECHSVLGWHHGIKGYLFGFVFTRVRWLCVLFADSKCIVFPLYLGRLFLW